MPQYNSAAAILTSISAMQWATQGVQLNRSKINRLFNGDAPWTEAERRANRLNTNFNWLEGTRIAANARSQMYNAFFSPGDFFDIKLDAYSGIPTHKRDGWSRCMTNYINRELRRDKRFRSSLEQAHAQVVLHGPGPSLWRNPTSPTPDTLGVDDILVPAGTLADMSNLDCLSIYREWTWSQLYDLTHGSQVDKGWNTPYIDSILASLYKQPLQPPYQGNRWLFPEKIAADAKENASLYAASALGKVLAWEFYYRDEENGHWNRRIILDYDNIQPEGLKADLQRAKPEFLYSKDDYAEDWSSILHWFMGNCSNVAPFRYYSIRSIGYLLYGVCLTQNTVRCRMTDHILQSLLTWFRNVSEDDRERLEDIQLHHLGIFPDGLSMVTAQERYTADWNLIGMGLQQNRQLMAESATSFLPDIAVEGDKPAMTATESLIRNNASVTLTSAVLNQLYNQSEPFYREICRRFALGRDSDPMTKRILAQMKEDNIPREVLTKHLANAEITPNRMMGGGNKAVELTTARALFEARGAFGPQADGPIKRKYALALTNDPQFVRELVPEVQQISSSAVLAQFAFGSLMEGVPVVQRGGLNEVDYIDTLIQMMAAAMKPLEALQEQPTALAVNAERIAGLVNVGAHIEQHIQALAADEQERETVRNFQNDVNGLMQQLKAYAERVTEMEQAQAHGNGASAIEAETHAKLAAMQTLAEAKAQIATLQAQLKAQHKDAAFIQEQERKDAATTQELRRKEVLTHAEVAASHDRAAADVAATDLRTRADLILASRQADHDRTQASADASQDRAHAEAEHATDLSHTEEKHEVDLKAAKAKAAVKPKAPANK